jgi:hypothetical protein
MKFDHLFHRDHKEFPLKWEIGSTAKYTFTAAITSKTLSTYDLEIGNRWKSLGAKSGE